MPRLTPLVVTRRVQTHDGQPAPAAIEHAAKFAIRPPPLFIDDYPGLGFNELGINVPRRIDLPTSFCLHLHDVRTIGFRHIVTPDHFLLNDRCTPPDILFADMREVGGAPYEDTDFVIDGEQILSERIEQVDVTVDEPLIMLNSHEPSNFGSWLFRILPKLATVQNHHLPPARLFVYARSPWQFSLLEFAGVPREQVLFHNVTQVYGLKELYVPSLRNPEAYLDHASVAFYRNLLAIHGIEQKKERMIYISRRNVVKTRPDVRAFMNEEAFIIELEKLGFEIIEPETMPFIEQVRLFASAKIILGPSGSGMFNCIFAPPGALFISIEAFPFWLHAHSNLPASVGLDYAFIVGEPDRNDPAPVHKRWSLDIGRAIERLKEVVQLRA